MTAPLDDRAARLAAARNRPPPTGEPVDADVVDAGVRDVFYRAALRKLAARLLPRPPRTR